MPRRCSICDHPERAAIDAELIAESTPIRGIARKYAVSEDALPRHRPHIDSTLVLAKEAKEVAQADGLLDRVKGLEADAKRLQAKAEKAGDLKTAIAAVREQGRIVELLARLLGELESGTRVAVAVNVSAPTPALELDPDTLEHEARLALELAAELRAQSAPVLVAEGRALPEAAP